MGNFLVVATTTGLIKMWDISRREPRQLGAGSTFTDKDDMSMGSIVSVRVNADGTRVSVLSTKQKAATAVPYARPTNPTQLDQQGPSLTHFACDCRDTKVHVLFTDLHKIEAYDFGPAGD